jgi:transketolase
LSAVKKTKCVVVAENHQIAGGLGSAIAETLSRENPLPIEFVGVQDTFGESGTPEEVLEKYGVHALTIERAVKKAILRKIK